MRPQLQRAALSLLLCSGCYLSHTPERRDGATEDSPPGFDAGPPAFDAGPPGFDAGGDGGPDAGRPCVRPAPVDLLLVIDDSGSMHDEQIHLATQLPRLVSDLVSPPDDDGDGRPDWRPIRDLHLGVVTTCALSDARLRTTSDPDTPGCSDSYPRFLSYAGGDPDEVSRDFACVAQVGVRGCGVEQPLEMALRALSPSAAELGFLDGPGQGDRFNDGFLRDDSLLAVVALTDEDDCSYADPDFLSGDWDPRELPPCMRDTDPLWPIERYVDGFRALRTDRPDLFAFAAIAGIPEFAIDDPTRPDYEALLAHPMMHYRVHPREGFGIVPACSGPRGDATPGRRLVQLAQRFEGQSGVASICQESFTPVVGNIARLVGVRACEEFEE